MGLLNGQGKFFDWKDLPCLCNHAHRLSLPFHQSQGNTLYIRLGNLEQERPSHCSRTEAFLVQSFYLPSNILPPLCCAKRGDGTPIYLCSSRYADVSPQCSILRALLVGRPLPLSR